MAAGTEDRPVVVVAEEPVGRRLHVQQVLRLGADPAEDAEDRLDEQRRLDHPLLEEVGEVVEVADVVALELEPSARARRASRTIVSMSLYVFRKMKSRVISRYSGSQSCWNVLTRSSTGNNPKFMLPMFSEQSSGSNLSRRPCALLDRHSVPAARRDVDHDVGALLDLRQELREDVGVGRRPARLRVARVQMDDRGPGLRPPRSRSRRSAPGVIGRMAGSARGRGSTRSPRS